MSQEQFGEDHGLRCYFRILDTIDFLCSRDDDEGQGVSLLTKLSQCISSETELVVYQSPLRFCADALIRLKMLSKYQPPELGSNEQVRARDEALYEIVNALHKFLPTFEGDREVPDKCKDLLRCPRRTQGGTIPFQFMWTVQVMQENGLAEDVMERLNEACRAWARHRWARVRARLPEILALRTIAKAP